MENVSTKKSSLFNHAAKGLFWLEAAFILSMTTIQPMGRLFPTAEGFLKEQGIDSSTITALTKFTDKKIHIGNPDLTGTAYFLYINPEITLKIALNGSSFSLPGNAFNSQIIDIITVLGGKDFYYVKPLKKNNLSAKEIIANKTMFPLAYIEHASVSTQDLYMEAVFHELRHTSSVNQSFSGLTREGDADYHATMSFINTTSGNPELKKIQVNNYSLMQFLHVNPEKIHLHNIALYLDARFKGQEPPEADVIITATIEAYRKMIKYMGLYQLTK